MAIQKLLTLDGTELSEHGRTFNQDRDERSVIIELANGDQKRYIKDIKQVFSISWNYLPDNDALTVDARAGRETLKSFVTTGNNYTLDVYDIANTSTISYDVFVEGYTEKLLRRDAGAGQYFWEISLQLVER
jgi:hypothetical protein